MSSAEEASKDDWAAAEERLEWAQERLWCADSSLEELAEEGDSAPSFPWDGDRHEKTKEKEKTKIKGWNQKRRKARSLHESILGRLVMHERPSPYHVVIGYPTR